MASATAINAVLLCSFFGIERLSLLGIEVQRHRPDRSNGRRDRHSIESKLLMYVLILYCLYQNWEETFFVCARFLQFGQSNTLVKKSCRMTKSLKVSFRTETHYKIFWVRFHHVRSLALHWVPSHSIVPGVTGISVCKHLHTVFTELLHKKRLPGLVLAGSLFHWHNRIALKQLCRQAFAGCCLQACSALIPDKM